jgi:hypothetical protein
MRWNIISLRNSRCHFFFLIIAFGIILSNIIIVLIKPICIAVIVLRFFIHKPICFMRVTPVAQLVSAWYLYNSVLFAIDIHKSNAEVASSSLAWRRYLIRITGEIFAQQSYWWWQHFLLDVKGVERNVTDCDRGVRFKIQVNNRNLSLRTDITMS